jgi:hypothetical protein
MVQAGMEGRESQERKPKVVEEGRRSGCHKHTRQAPDIPTREKSQTRMSLFWRGTRWICFHLVTVVECALARGRDSLKR